MRWAWVRTPQRSRRLPHLKGVMWASRVWRDVRAWSVRGYWIWSLGAPITMGIRFKGGLRVETSALRVRGSHSTLLPLALPRRVKTIGLNFRRLNLDRVGATICIRRSAVIITDRGRLWGRRRSARARGPIWGEDGVWRDGRIHHSATTPATDTRAVGVVADPRTRASRAAISSITARLIPVFRILLLMAGFFSLVRISL